MVGLRGNDGIDRCTSSGDCGLAYGSGMDVVLSSGLERFKRQEVDEPSPTPELLPPAEALPYVEQSNEAEIICSFNWPQGCGYWIAVSDCESGVGTDPWAYDVRNSYTGLFQVWEGHGYGYTWLINDANNAQAAWELSDGGTYTGAWPYCQWQ